METKEFTIQCPAGYEIDKKKSTFEKIVFKPIEQKRWRDKLCQVSGYFISDQSNVICGGGLNNLVNRNLFATEKQAKSALAMAQISQIMANDERFGGVVTDEEWGNTAITKYVLFRRLDKIDTDEYLYTYFFLAFHTPEQRELFLEENRDLVEQYLML